MALDNKQSDGLTRGLALRGVEQPANDETGVTELGAGS